MKTEHMGRSTVKITLTGRELARSGLTVSDITGKTPLAVLLLGELVHRICPDQEEYAAEAIPTKDGGCILYITKAVPCSDERIRTLLTFSSAQALCGSCSLLFRMGICPADSSVYYRKGKLCLIAELPPEDSTVYKAAASKAEQIITDECLILHITEHGRELIFKNAISTAAEAWEYSLR